MTTRHSARPLLRVGIAGAGMISAFHLRAWQSLGDRVAVVAISDPHHERAAQRAGEFSIPAVHADPAAMLASERLDVVDIASPRETHVELVEAAAARGIAVLCQKPLAPTLPEALALVERVGSRTRLMVHENWRFRPWFRSIRQWLDAGELGELLYARLALFTSGLIPDAEGNRPALKRQAFMQHVDRLMVTEVLIHHIDAMRYLLGDLRLVRSRMRSTIPDVRGETVAILSFEAGSGAPVDVVGTLAAIGYPARNPDRLELIGTRGSVLLADDELRLDGRRSSRLACDREAGYQASFDNVMRHFVDCLRDGRQFETGPADNLRTLALVEEAYTGADLPG